MKYAVVCLVLSIGLCLAGCHRAPPAATPVKLHLFAFSDYLPKEVIDGFTRESGIPVSYEVYDTNEAMLAKLAPGSAQYDVIQPSEYTVEFLIKQNGVAELDPAQIPNLANLLPEFRTLAYDPGNRHSVPYMSGTVCIVVNTDKIKEPILGYKDLFQRKYSGRILVLDDNREIVTWAMETAGLPINEMTPANLAKVRPTIKSWLPLIKHFTSDSPRNAFVGGDVDLGIIYSGDAARLINDDKKFKYILPAEGAHRWIDNLCIPAGSKNREAAHKFINYVLRPEVSKLISDNYPYTNPNAEARKLLKPEQLANPASYPPTGGSLEIFHDIGKSAADISAMMTELRG